MICECQQDEICVVCRPKQPLPSRLIMKATRSEVYTAIDGERDYQASRATAIGDTDEHQHTLSEWVVYIEDYLAELKHSLSRVWRKDGQPTENELNILRKVTAMGVAAMEQNGAPRREGF